MIGYTRYIFTVLPALSVFVRPYVLPAACFYLVLLSVAGFFRIKGKSESDHISQYPGNSVTGVIIFLIFCIGLILRITDNGVLPFWWDELLTVWVSESDIPTLLRTLLATGTTASDANPPLFYLIEHYWIGFFGTSESGIRILPAIFSALTIPTSFMIGRIIHGNLFGLVLAVTVCFSPMSIFYGYQNRSYALLSLMADLTFIQVITIAKVRSQIRKIISGIAVFLTLFAHYSGLWLLVSLSGAYFIEFFVSLPFKRKVPKNVLWIRLRRTLVTAIVMVIIIFGIGMLIRFPESISKLLNFQILTPFLALIYITATGILSVIRISEHPNKNILPFRQYLAIAVTVLSGFGLWLYFSGAGSTIGGLGSDRISLAAILKTVSEFAASENQDFSLGSGIGNFYIWLYLFMVGFLYMALDRPRYALYLGFWFAGPVLLAAVYRNQHVLGQLTRYLFFTQTSFLVLVCYGIFAPSRDAITGMFSGIKRRVYHSFFGFGLTEMSIAAVSTVLLVNTVIGNYWSKILTPDPAGREYENYPAIVKSMEKYKNYCLLIEHQNMVKWIDWYNRQRYGFNLSDCDPQAGFLFIASADLAGRGEVSEDIKSWIDKYDLSVTKVAVIKGANLYTLKRPEKNMPLIIDTEDRIRLNFSDIGFRKHILAADNTVWIRYRAKIKPLSKNKIARIVFPVTVGENKKYKSVRLKFSGTILGRESYVRFTLNKGRKEIIRRKFTEDRYTATVISQPVNLTAGDDYRLAIDMFDDYSGALYSSDVTVETFQLEFN